MDNNGMPKAQFDFLLGSTQQISARYRIHDWSRCMLGSLETWPQELQVAAGIMLTSHHPMCIAWGDSLCLLYNDAYARLLGERHPRALGQPIADVWSDIWDSIGPLVARTTSGISVWMEDMHLITLRNGYAEDTWWTFCFSPLRVAGKVSGMLNICTDTTSKVIAERARRETEARQTFLLKLSDQLRPLADPAEIQSTAMRVLTKHLGISRAQYFEADASGEYVESLGSYVHGATPHSGRYRIGDFGPFVIATLHAGRTYVVADAATDQRINSEYLKAYTAAGIVSCVTVPLLKEGNFVAALSINHHAARTWSNSEIAIIEETAERVWTAAERARAIQALRESEAALRVADHRKNEFLGILAHELRNPLAPIHNGVTLLEAGIDPSRLAAVSKMMKRQVGQMARLIDDLLDVSRVTEGKIELRKMRCDLGAAITRAVEANQPLREKLGHKLLLVKSGRPVHVFADLTRLTQIIGNLLNNACKFTDRGGQIFLSVQSDDTHAVIRVRDTGIGMSREQIPKLFELFSQADTSLARAESGLGIGLAVVKRLVEMHGGTVAASSPGLGQGSEFVVRLPLDTDSFAPMPEPSPNSRHSASAGFNRLH
ncbi:MAG: hypothetical protein RLZZ227_2493 [Pseudomonadota bacterium]|jgi:signal transduction histidine kinase